MPLYEYRCSKCDRVFEVLQKFSDAPLELHGDCGGPVERLISAPSFRFKGSGWYITDYKNAAPKAEANGAEAKGDEAKGDEAKGDAKPPEAKADSKAEAASASSETKTESKPAAETAKK
ncbi:MAG TPA: zinc ribbon domain-containing protein [Bryobacteraceae bacterium]